MSHDQIIDRFKRNGYEIATVTNGKVFIKKDGKGKIFSSYNAAHEYYFKKISNRKLTNHESKRP